ncbi:flagellar filament capping protein FliD [Vogesella oryzae]|uniref:flagellar filament capping protein FliD n=1 Tax=Vogesella oryzae TaxID=1735285 RepID=UPI001583F853|nr:flagellar filament capping protein FliD [Vogesella oryzae]
MSDVSSINPSQLAQQLATAYIQDTQSLLDSQSQRASSASKALTTLQSALQAFQTAISGLSGKKTVLQQTATVSNTAVANASTNGSAQAGSYNFFVTQLASANQLAYQGIPTSVTASSAGTLGVSLADGSSFSVSLASGDLDGDGNLTPAEIARAINQAAGNSSKVAASVMTVNGAPQLVLTAGQTGAGSQITLDTSAVGDSSLQSALNAAPVQLVAAQDADIWLGAENSGIHIQQASNTYSGISGVTINFTQAMTSGSAPVTLTVASDNAGTAKNVQAFVDAYNTLKQKLDDLTDTGDAASGKSAAVFANDAGIRSLRNKLESMLRQSFNSQTLFSYGVSADRNGTLSLNQSKLDAALAANPSGLDQLLGGSSGLLAGNSNYLKLWLSSVGGQLKQRQESVGRLQTDLARRQDQLSVRYDQAYNRYLLQFTQLQTLQSRMSDTSGILANLGS